MQHETLKSCGALYLVAVAAFFLASAVEAQTTPAQAPATAHAASMSTAVDVRLAMRKLWEEHIVYTRNYIISALADLPDATAQRLLSNQDDIGNAIKPYLWRGSGEETVSAAA